MGKAKDSTPEEKNLYYINEASYINLINPISQTSIEIGNLSLPLIKTKLNIENKNTSTLTKYEFFPIYLLLAKLLIEETESCTPR